MMLNTIKNKISKRLDDLSGVNDSSSAVILLGDKGFISFKTELIDDESNKTIGTIKEFNLNNNNLHPYKLSSYKLSKTDLIEKEVRVKITISTNIDNLEFALMDEYSTIDEASLSKISVQEISLKKAEVITNYSLAQNYPNPFNPTTKIIYQLPQDGMVTLKVYDMLGQEVATLVNEYKTSGRYNVNFNGSNLASGVYIYQLKVNSNKGNSSTDYSATKKLILLK